MIPRTKPNYGFGALFQALFSSTSGTQNKDRLRGILTQYLGPKKILFTPSGRAGLYFVLKACDKSKVILPAYTCKAVVEAALFAGKQLRFVANDPGSFNMSARMLDQVIDSDCAVVATHQFGIPCDIKDIVQLCRKKGALVIEDMAAALGSQTNGQKCGSFGDAAFYSFDTTKLLNTPLKAGFVTVEDRALFEKLKSIYEQEITTMPFFHKMKLLASAAVLVMIRNGVLYRLFHTLYFSARGKWTEETSTLQTEPDAFYKFDMADWQAGILIEQAERLDEIIRRRRELYKTLRTRLGSPRSFVLPPEDKNKEWACIRFPILVNDKKMPFYHAGCKRGVDFAFSFSSIACPPEFKPEHALAAQILDIPYYPDLDGDELNFVIDTLKDIDNTI